MMVRSAARGIFTAILSVTLIIVVYGINACRRVGSTLHSGSGGGGGGGGGGGSGGGGGGGGGKEAVAGA